jgi:hypothetical protein
MIEARTASTVSLFFYREAPAHVTLFLLTSFKGSNQDPVHRRPLRVVDALQLQGTLQKDTRRLQSLH